MNAENLRRDAGDEESQITDWDSLGEVVFLSDTQQEEQEDAEAVEFTRKIRKLPGKIEAKRREIARRLAPNTMPPINVLAHDASRERLSLVDDLCKNWPLFDHTQRAKLDGVEVNFPNFFTQINYTGEGLDYTGYLSTPNNPSAVYEQIKEDVGKKNASIYVEACLDNPLVATMLMRPYEGNDNSNYCSRRSQDDGLLRSEIHLIDESMPLSSSMSALEARMAGVENPVLAETAGEAEAIDTIQRAIVAYHEIGHGMDYLVNYLRLDERTEINNALILLGERLSNQQRSMEIECCKKMPDLVRTHQDYITEQQWATMLERRGFKAGINYSMMHLTMYDERRYREMPCEAIADDYAREAVCIRHRDHYFAKNELERRQNPDKKNLPIYGQIVYMGEVSNEQNDESLVLDYELMGCGLIAGQQVEIFEHYAERGISVDSKTNRVKMPDDYDFDAENRARQSQYPIAEGTISRNPCNGRFEVVDSEGQVIATIADKYYRQQNDEGEIEIINGDLAGDRPIYRIHIVKGDDKEKQVAKQCGPWLFNRFLGINEDEEANVLFINDNCATQVLLPKGGFDLGGELTTDTGAKHPMPVELMIFNGIPKVKIGEQYYEVVLGSKEDLAALKQKIAEASKPAPEEQLTIE